MLRNDKKGKEKEEEIEIRAEEITRTSAEERQEDIIGFNSECEVWIQEGSLCRDRGAYKEAIQYFKKVVDREYPMGWAYLAQMHVEGLGVDKSRKEAKKLFDLVETEMLRDNVIAWFSVGRMYDLGHGVEKNKVEAVYWYQKAAKQGHAVAQNNLGVCYEKDQDYVRAVYWYKRAAEQGNRVAQCNFGLCYEKGRGVDKNYKNAVYWYEKAAEQGNILAQCNLGLCYEKGRGINKDDFEAVYWYEKAAEQGNARAQCGLALFYEKDQGVDEDYVVKAFYWYQKAAEQGYALAQFNLGGCYQEGRGINKDDVKAFYWYQKAAEQGNVRAQCRLALCYEKGRGIGKSDVNKAVYWYERAAAQENARAQCRLALCYKKGRGVDKNYEKAVYWYKKAASQGYVDAKTNLSYLAVIENHVEAHYVMGELLCEGKGFSKNEEKGVESLLKAAKQNHVGAADKLHEIAEGGNQDAEKALEELRSLGLLAINIKRGSDIVSTSYKQTFFGTGESSSNASNSELIFSDKVGCEGSEQDDNTRRRCIIM